MGDNDGKDLGKDGGKKKGKAEPKPPDLYDGAPQDVVDFVECKGETLTIDPKKKGSIPEIPIIGAPEVKVEKGAKDGTAKISLKKTGIVDTSFTVGVKDGHLDADTKGVEPGFVKDAIDKWVKKYNRWLDAKKRKLDGVTVDKGTITIKKAAQTGAYAPNGGMGTGTKVALGIGAAVLLVGGGYAAYQAISDDDGGSPQQVVAAAAPAPDDGAAPVGDLGSFECTGTVNCDHLDALVQGVGVSISHDGSPAAADAPSNAQYTGVTTWDDLIQIAANCAGFDVSGQAMPDGDGVFQVDLPLYQFGPCQITELKLKTGATFSDGLPVDALDVTTWDVTENPVPLDQDALQANIDLLAEYDRAMAQDSAAVVHVFNPGQCVVGTLLSDAAVRQALADGICGGAIPYGIQAVDSADGGPGTVGGVTYTGADADAIRAYFQDDGEFPCGPGPTGLTICPDNPPIPDGTSSMVLFQAGFPGGTPQPVTIDLLGGGSVTVTPDGADSSMSVTGDVPAWSVIRNGVITFLLPGQQADTIQVEGGPEVTLDPPVAVSGVQTGPPAGGPTDESLEAFLTTLGQSLANRDADYLNHTVDPAVLQLFPTARCRAHFEGLAPDPTYAIVLVNVGATGPYAYAPPSLRGPSVDVAGVTTATADVTEEGQTNRVDLHVHYVDGAWHWFTDCGGD